MLIARQPSLRLVGATQKCLRRRFFSTSVYRREDKSSEPSSLSAPANKSIPDTPGHELLKNLTSMLVKTPMVGGRSGRGRVLDRAANSFRPTSISQLARPDANNTKPPPLPQMRASGQHPGYFYIHGVATTRNIHVTIADHKHNPVIVTSGGRHGLKHSKRQTIEAGYTTTVAAFEKFAKSNYEVREVEIVLKGFGQGRKGFLSALEGHHGEFIRNKVVRVTDATPMQIGHIKAHNKRRN